MKCLTYTRQDNPFCQVVGVVPVKGRGEALVIKQQSRSLLKVVLADDYFYWGGPQGHVDPAFKDLYDRLPWQPGPVPVSATQP